MNNEYHDGQDGGIEDGMQYVGNSTVIDTDMRMVEDVIAGRNGANTTSLLQSCKSLNIFVSGKYTGGCYADVESNIRTAQTYAQALMLRGHNVFCPHTMTAHWEDSAPDILYGEYMDMCKEYLRSWADAIFMLPNWTDSYGAKIEHDIAETCRIDIYYNMSNVPFYLGRIANRYVEEE